MGVVYEELLDTGPVTLLRFSGLSGERLLLVEGEIIDTPMAFRGAYADIKLRPDVPVIDLVNTIMVNGCEHHYSIAKTHHGEVVEEAAYWLGIEKMNFVPFESGKNAFGIRI